MGIEPKTRFNGSVIQASKSKDSKDTEHEAGYNEIFGDQSGSVS